VLAGERARNRKEREGKKEWSTRQTHCFKIFNCQKIYILNLQKTKLGTRKDAI
jgi:hypothetical protein